MRKALLTVLLVSVIVFVSISFMAASCIVTPGPGPDTYTLTIYNNSGFPIQIYYNGVLASLVVNNGGTYIDSVTSGTAVDAEYFSAGWWFDIRGTGKFPFNMPFSNKTVTVLGTDIGISSER